MRNGLLASLLVFSAASFLASQTCVNVSTAYDQDGGVPLDPGVADDDYTVDLADGSLGAPPAYVVEEDGFPIPPWVANTDRSRWIGFNVPDSNSVPGTYYYEIHFIMPAEVDASKAVLIGKWGTDDQGPGFEINGTFVSQSSDGFGVLKRFAPDTGLGLFTAGENVIRFQVVNGGDAANPTGLRVDACVGVPVAVDRPFDLSTGFDEANKLLFGDGAADDDYRVTGPPGSGVANVPAVCVTDDDFPIPPWLANSVNSRWVGLDAGDSSGPAGTYSYRTSVILPATNFDATRAILSGGMTAGDSIEDVLVNGKSAGVTASDPGALVFFPVDAGQGLFKKGINSIELLVSKGEAGSTGLRVDGEVLLGPEVPNPLTGGLSIDTGFDDSFDDATQATIGNGLPDDNYVILGPPGSGVGPSLATVVNDDAFPIPPWVGSTARSKWIAGQADSNGPAGVYTYKIKLNIPADRDASQARIVGSWAVDDGGVDVVVNGTPTGIGNGGGFVVMTPFPPGAGQGLFQTGDNEIRFLVNNGGGPTGLRVEAVVGFEDPRPSDLSTGIDVRGIGLVSPGAPDPRYTVTGPEGSGIVSRRAVVVPADGSPIPPWAASSAGSQWVGLDGADSVGPPGMYRYSMTFSVGPGVNPHRLALSGSWAAAGSGLDVVLNGSSLDATAAGPESLTPFAARAGRGFFVQGLNTLELVVENDAEGSTGLRVEAALQTVVEANPLDVSTGFDQSAGQILAEGDQDSDYNLTDTLFATDLAWVVLGAPIPPWIENTATSKWIGASTGGSSAPPGQYAFEILATIDTDEQAAGARLVGGWATDDHGDGVVVNGTLTGLVNDGGFGGLTLFPPDAGLGLFTKGTNTIQFLVTNGGLADNPMGLRVDAVVEVPEAPPPPRDVFVRGDVNADGSLNLTDAVAVLLYLFSGGTEPLCFDAADSDDNGQLQLTDAIRVLGWLFLGGLPPAPPSPSATTYALADCGVDPTTGDVLDCKAFPGCH